jgi:hypothetical protein
VKLTDFGHDEYSQFGEDGIIQHVFDKIGTRSKFCVEFGASDGKMCSNTKWLRDGYDWSALLIEADSERFEGLMQEFRPGVQCINAAVTPENLDEFIAGRQVDFMSIDVDGDDYAIFEGMACRPRLVCIEHNATIPPDVDLRQKNLGEGFGSSALALTRLAESKEYSVIGMNKANLFLVPDEYSYVFNGYDRDLDSLFDPSWLTYVVTDFQGRPAIVGNGQWGIKSLPYMGFTVGDQINPYTKMADVVMAGLADQYGMPVRMIPRKLNLGITDPGDPRHVGRSHKTEIANLLRNSPDEILVLDITNHGVSVTFEWIETIAESCGFYYKIVPSALIAFIPKH